MARSPKLDTKYSVLVFKASRDPMNYGAVGIARSLGRLGVPVYALVEDAYTPLATSRYIKRAFVWETWPADRDAFVNAISTIGATIGAPIVLFPIDDLAAISVAENAPALVGRFLLPQLPAALPRQMANKATFYVLCREMGIPCARSVVPRCFDDVRQFIDHTAFPIVMKAAEQWSLVGNKLYTRVIENRETLLEIYKLVQSEERSPMILQEYIPGEDWIYHGYSNHGTGLNLGFTGRKLLDYPKGAGSTALGISLHNEALCGEAETLLRAIGYSGICDLDWRRDKRDGQYRILDCNPRIGLNFQMFENTAGIDVVRALHLDLTGRKMDQAPMIEGRLFVAEHLYLRSVLRGERPSVLTTEPSAPPLIITRKLAWWSIDDPLPFVVMGMRVIFAAIVRRLIRATQFLGGLIWASPARN